MSAFIFIAENTTLIEMNRNNFNHSFISLQISDYEYVYLMALGFNLLHLVVHSVDL